MFERLTSKVVLLALRGLTREIRHLREVQETWTDTYCRIHGHPPVYATPDPQPIPTTDFRVKVGQVITPGDYLTPWLIEELCLENGIPLTSDLDIEALALDRGWLLPNGEMAVHPRVFVENP